MSEGGDETEIGKCWCYNQILRLKCTKIDFSWGSNLDPDGGAYGASPEPLAGFKQPYF